MGCGQYFPDVPAPSQVDECWVDECKEILVGGYKEILPSGLIGKVPFYGSPKCPGRGKRGCRFSRRAPPGGTTSICESHRDNLLGGDRR